jgi:hypothetical protein
MAKYKKKPVVIEAFRFQIDDVMPDWFNKKRITNEIITREDGTCDIKTLEGTMRADKGDYVILGVKSEVYPCKPDIFEATYEKVLPLSPLLENQKIDVGFMTDEEWKKHLDELKCQSE